MPATARSSFCFLTLSCLASLALTSCHDAHSAGLKAPVAGLDAPYADGALTVAQALQRLSSRTIFFHHKSVGGDIVAGVKEHLADNPGSGLQVMATRDPSALRPGTFAHADLDSDNGSAIGKIADFRRVMDGGVAAKAQLAFMKLCFADFNDSTDEQALFDRYRSTLAQLKADHPGVRFVHVTAPLTTGDDRSNVIRQKFNALMRDTYTGKEPLFDLAKAEATCPDGSVTVGSWSRAPGLCPALTSDGGHLNAKGRKLIAGRLLTYLASIP